jgi:hypothetical protein
MLTGQYFLATALVDHLLTLSMTGMAFISRVVSARTSYLIILPSISDFLPVVQRQEAFYLKLERQRQGS